VQWDHAVPAMTYGRSPPAEDTALTIKQMTDDGTELAAYIAQRFSKQKSSSGAVRGLDPGRAHGQGASRAVLRLSGTSQLVIYHEGQAASYAKLLGVVRAPMTRRRWQYWKA